MRTIVWLPSFAIACACIAAAIAWFESPAPESLSKIPSNPKPALAQTECIIVPDVSEHPASPEVAPSKTESEEPDAAEWVGQRAEIVRRKAELQTALKAAGRIPDLERRNEALTALCYRWAELDPREALQLALSCRLDQAPGAVVENLAQQWAAADLAAAREWIDAQPPSDFRSDLAARIGFLWAQTDAKAAAQYVLREITPGPVQEEAVISVLHQWAQQDAASALAWAQTFPSGDLRDRALHEVLSFDTGPEGRRTVAPGDSPENRRR